MSWFKDNRREALFIVLTLALPVVLVLWLMLNLLGMRAGYQDEIERIEPRVARLAGLKQFARELSAAAGQVDTDVLSLIYPPTEDRAAASTSLQKSVRDVFAEAGVSVSGSQMLSPRTEDGLEYIAVKVTAQGELADIDAALSELYRHRPMLMVESLDAYPARRGARHRGRETQTLTVSLQILALRQAG